MKELIKKYIFGHSYNFESIKKLTILFICRLQKGGRILWFDNVDRKNDLLPNC